MRTALRPSPWREESLRGAAGEALLEAARQDPRIVALTADVSPALNLREFKSALPERFFNVGVAEQNLMGVGAGLASVGLIPFCTTFSIFVMRALEQVRLSVCAAGLPVKICATHAGLGVGENGVSHQALEDLAAMRALPELTVLVPADAVEARAVISAAVQAPGPVFIRLPRPSFPTLFEPGYRFQIGQAHLLREGGDLTLATTGTMLGAALEAAEVLAAQSIRAEVLHFPTLKPLDVERLVASARRTRGVVTCEDHSVIGGLGGAVSEALAEHHPTRVVRVGTEDRFCESGPWAQLQRRYGLDCAGVLAGARKLLELR